MSRRLISLVFVLALTLWNSETCVKAQDDYEPKSQTIHGGKPKDEFPSCQESSCGHKDYCCKFQDTFKLQEVEFYCMSDERTMGIDVGLYQDQHNYPYMQYYWYCGDRIRYNKNWNAEGVKTRTYIPVELVNTEFWQWTWLILMTYLISGGGWLLGYLIFFPFSTVLNVYNFAILIYATQMLLFEDPQRLFYDIWLQYPLRRFVIGALIVALGYFYMPIPGISAFTMPILGVWAVQDFIDYAGWDQMGETLSIPFDRYYYNPQ